MLNNLKAAGLVVATIALVAAGTASALPGKNKVDSGDLKKGSVTSKALKSNSVTGKAIKAAAVTAADLADNSVTSAKIVDNAVTGADVDESTLGSVPTAASANNVAYQEQFFIRMSFGQDVLVADNGEVSLRARCVLNGQIDGGATGDGIEVYARTTANGSFLAGDDDFDGDTDGDGLENGETLDVADSINDSSFAALSTDGAAPPEGQVGTDIDDGYVVAPDGSYLALDTETLLLAYRSLGSDCVVAGTSISMG